MNPPGADGSERPKWSPPDSPLVYTPAQVKALTPIRDSIEKQAAIVAAAPIKQTFTFSVTRIPWSDFFTIHLVDLKTGLPNGQTEELDTDETYEWFRIRGADMITVEKALDHCWNFARVIITIVKYKEPPIKNPHLQPRLE